MVATQRETLRSKRQPVLSKDLPLRHNELQPEVLTEIESAVADGNKIEAIRIYREATGAGLSEAKMFVEDLGRNTDVDMPAMVEAVTNALADGQFVGAVKAYRDATGKGLKEAKDFVDALIPELVEQDPERFAKVANRGSGCASIILLAVALTGLAMIS